MIFKTRASKKDRTQGNSFHGRIRGPVRITDKLPRPLKKGPVIPRSMIDPEWLLRHENYTYPTLRIQDGDDDQAQRSDDDQQTRDDINVKQEWISQRPDDESEEAESEASENAEGLEESEDLENEEERRGEQHDMEPAGEYALCACQWGDDVIDYGHDFEVLRPSM